MRFCGAERMRVQQEPQRPEGKANAVGSTSFNRHRQNSQSTISFLWFGVFLVKSIVKP